MDVKGAASFLKNLFFPIFCVSCKKEGVFLCKQCEKLIQPFENLWHPTVEPLKTFFAPFPYNEGEVLSKLIHLLKYDFAYEANETIAQLMKPVLQKHAAHFQNGIFVPVPLHEKRDAWRGFNQSFLIAQSIGKILGIPVMPLLARIRNTKPQADLPREKRLTNVIGAFDVATLPSSFPEKIFLVDDVTSTGATLRECAKTIQKYFDCEVHAIVFAKA